MDCLARKVFNEEVREKKVIASGVHHRTGKRGYVGKMLFPSDLITGKEKRRYRKCGKVEVHNMYDNLISYEQFLNLNENEQKQHLTAYRERFSNKEIQQEWKIGSNTLYKLVHNLKLPKAPRTDRKLKSKRSGSKVPAVQAIVEPTPVMTQPAVNEAYEGFGFVIKGNHSTDKLVKRLEKLSLILSDEESEFYVDIRIKEVR